MPLPIRDGNQSLTTLSTILVSNAHIPAHTVVSLGAQAITDIATAVSGVLTDSQLRASAVTIGGGVYLAEAQVVLGANAPAEAVQVGGYSLADNKLYPIAVDDNGVQSVSGTVTANVVGFNPTPNETFGTGVIQAISDSEKDTIRSSLWIADSSASNGFASDGQILSQNYPMPISGTVTANVVGFNPTPNETFGTGVIQLISDAEKDTIRASLWIADSSASNGFASDGQILSQNYPMPISGTVTIAAGTVTIGAGTSQIGSVTASISNFPATQPVSLATLPALVAGTAQIGSVTASISGTVPISISSVTVGNSVTIASLPAISGTVTANLSISSTAITSGSFTSLTSATLVPANTARKMATVYNLGAGQLFVNAGVTATTLGGGFMVALSSGDFYECPYTTTTLSAIFATAGTASWVSH